MLRKTYAVITNWEETQFNWTVELKKSWIILYLAQMVERTHASEKVENTDNSSLNY